MSEESYQQNKEWNDGYNDAVKDERGRLLMEFEDFWEKFKEDFDVDGRRIMFELTDSDLEFLKTKTKEIIKK
ncbi:MAG: hypothetical protein ACOCRX_08385 [Candidatus Woesearchaeota archaeon]